MKIIPEDSELDIVPTVGFQRVLQRSVYQAQSAQKNTVYAMNVLVLSNALFLPFFGLDFTVDTSSSDSGERVEIASMTSRREMLLSFNK
jgi:hypothetical protein